MQYLGGNPRESAIVDTQKNKPYRVQSILQSALSRFATDKISNNCQLFLIASFKSTAVVENITVVFREDEFVLYAMVMPLQGGSSRLAVTNKNKHVQPGRVEPARSKKCDQERERTRSRLRDELIL